MPYGAKRVDQLKLLNIMKAIILCGGQGTRLREHTELLPKPMVEIGGRPILWHIMRTYAAHGIKDFIICLGYKGQLIRQYFLNFESMVSDFTITLGKPDHLTFHNQKNDDLNWRVTLVDTGEATMTGARVLKAAKYLDTDNTFCLTYGDGLTNVNISEVIKLHKQERRLLTVTGVRPASRFGEMETRGNQVINFAEKPQMQTGLINGGYFVAEKEFLKYLSGEDSCVLEKEPLEECSKAGQMTVYEHTGFWQCMDTYRDWLYLENLWQQKDCPWRV